MILSEIDNTSKISSLNKFLAFARFDPATCQSPQFELNFKILKRASKYSRWQYIDQHI